MATALVCVCLAAGLSPSAQAAQPIEAVWSFNGGQVAIHPGPAGTFIGTVVQATSFAQCSHPVGEEMWSGLRVQPDGSYWGLHQWFFETTSCVHNPALGPTAWRVMAAGSSRYLLVCFSPPGGPQPTIAPDGTEGNVTYGCRQSAPIAATPTQPTSTRVGQARFAHSVTLPSNRRCFSARIFKIHLKDPSFDPLQSVLVTLGQRRVKVTRHGNRFAATISLRGLPRGTFTVKVQERTVLGHRLRGSRTYHTCARRAAGGRAPRPAPTGRR